MLWASLGRKCCDVYGVTMNAVNTLHQRSMDWAESATLAQQRGESVTALWREAFELEAVELPVDARENRGILATYLHRLTWIS
jgi:hypothetical protein